MRSLRHLVQAAIFLLAAALPLSGQNIVPMVNLAGGYRVDVRFEKGHTPQKPNQTMRLRSPEGKPIIDFGRYQKIESSAAASHLFKVTKGVPHSRDGTEFGIFDINSGKEVLPCGPYTYLQFVQGTIFVVGAGKLNPKTSLPERFGVFDIATAQELHPCSAQEIKIYPGRLLYMVDAQRQVALLGLDGRELAAQRYRFAAYRPDGQPNVVSIKLANGNLVHGYVDSSGKPLTPVQYSKGDIFTSGVAVVTRDGLSGFIDETGREVVPPRYAYITPFVDGIAGYAKRGHNEKKPGELFETFLSNEWGLISRDGRELCPPIYEAVALPTGEHFVKDKIHVKYEGRWLTIEPQLGAAALDRAVPTQPQLYHSTRDGNFFYGYLIPGGGQLTPPRWEIATNFDAYGHAIVGTRTKLRAKEIAGRDAPFATLGLIDRQGRRILPEDYAVIEPLAPTRYAAGKWDAQSQKARVGIIDVVTGETILPPNYEQITRSTDTLFAARQNGRVGLISASGNWHLEPRFFEIKPFAETHAVVRDENGYTWIDREFKIVSEQRYIWAGDFQNDRAWVATRIDNWGRTAGIQQIDRAGNVVGTRPDLGPPVYTAREQRCSACGGSGGRFTTKENSSSYYVGDTLRNYEPGGSSGNFRTVNWKESVRIGDCNVCEGRGTR